MGVITARLARGSGPARKAAGERMDALRRRWQPSLTGYILKLALVALAYYGAGRIGLALAYLNGAVAALWPPAGLGVAVLFLYGLRLWPAIVIGDLFLGDYSTPLGTVLAKTVGNTVAVVAAALLLRRWRPGILAAIQVAAITAYTLAATVLWPSLWLEPLGPIFKNVPILVAVLAWAAIEEER